MTSSRKVDAAGAADAAGGSRTAEAPLFTMAWNRLCWLGRWVWTWGEVLAGGRMGKEETATGMRVVRI